MVSLVEQLLMLKELFLVTIGVLGGFYFRKLFERGSKALLEKQISRIEEFELECGSYTFDVKVRLVDEVFYFQDPASPSMVPYKVAFTDLATFKTILFGIIGRDLGNKGTLATLWVKEGILTLRKVKFELYDGLEKFEYTPEISVEGEIIGFHNRNYRRIIVSGGQYKFAYIRDGVPNSNRDYFIEANKSKNDLDCDKFFSEESLSNEGYFDPIQVRETRSALKRYSTRSGPGQFTGLIKYYLDHPEMGLKRIC